MYLKDSESPTARSVKETVEYGKSRCSPVGEGVEDNPRGRGLRVLWR